MESLEKKKRVSFSQYSTFLKCPHKWKLDYIDNLREREDSINTTFGTAIHHAFQTYLESLYNESVSKADSLNVKQLFQDKFAEEIKKVKEINEEEYTDFIFDGHDIIDTFLKTSNRIKHFPSTYDLIGIEIPLEIPMKNNVDFVGFIDLVLKEKNKEKYRIIDFKTSSSGWNQYMKEDESKYSQLHLYKSVYSKKFNVPLNAIDVEFFIVKRRLYENVSFPQSRIQIFKPASGSTMIKESISNFIEFLDHCFNEDGTYNNINEYPKIPGKNKKNCKWCPHKKVSCDAKPSKLLD
jgi:hypothetical protein